MKCGDLNAVDPLKKQPTEGVPSDGLSPMDPPDAYAPPGVEDVPYEKMPKILQNLMDDHKAFEAPLKSFEEALGKLRENGLAPDKEVDEALRSFFSFLDDQMIGHEAKEEKILFPLLQERLIEKGEHGGGDMPTTAIDMLEDDHSKVMQLAAVTFNFLGLAARLPDAPSSAIVLDAALEQGEVLTELLRLHMFREDSIVFPLAAKHLTDTEFGEMELRLTKAVGRSRVGCSDRSTPDTAASNPKETRTT